MGDLANTKAPPTSLPPRVQKENQVAVPGPPCWVPESTTVFTIERIQSTCLQSRGCEAPVHRIHVPPPSSGSPVQSVGSVTGQCG